MSALSWASAPLGRDTARAMSRENVGVVRRMYEAFNRLAENGDFVAYVGEHFDPDCEYGPVEEAEPVRGRTEMVDWHERWFEAWDEFWADVDEVIEAGDRVLTVLTVHGRGGVSGMQIDQRFFHVFDIRHDKILRMEEFVDRDEALEAAGLSEQDADS